MGLFDLYFGLFCYTPEEDEHEDDEETDELDERDASIELSPKSPSNLESRILSSTPAKLSTSERAMVIGLAATLTLYVAALTAYVIDYNRNHPEKHQDAPAQTLPAEQPEKYK